MVKALQAKILSQNVPLVTEEIFVDEVRVQFLAKTFFIFPEYH